jgi:hypothetical protein
MARDLLIAGAKIFLHYTMRRPAQEITKWGSGDK